MDCMRKAAYSSCRRTLKFLLGVLNGKWMLHTSWVAACLKHGAPVEEEAHEVQMDSAGQQGGPVLGRLQAGLKPLKGWEVSRSRPLSACHVTGCHLPRHRTPKYLIIVPGIIVIGMDRI